MSVLQFINFILFIYFIFTVSHTHTHTDKKVIVHFIIALASIKHRSQTQRCLLRIVMAC